MRRHLTVLHTTDLHAQIAPHSEFSWSPGDQLGAPLTWRTGSLASLRTYVDAVRRAHPDEVLLVDTGDALLGSAVATWTRGQLVPPLLNRLRYDAMSPGTGPWRTVSRA